MIPILYRLCGFIRAYVFPFMSRWQRASLGRIGNHRSKCTNARLKSA